MDRPRSLPDLQDLLFAILCGPDDHPSMDDPFHRESMPRIVYHFT